MSEVLELWGRVLAFHAVERCGGNRTKAAKWLGMNRTTLSKRLRRAGVGEHDPVALKSADFNELVSLVESIRAFYECDMCKTSPCRNPSDKLSATDLAVVAEHATMPSCLPKSQTPRHSVAGRQR